jgi:hypothetical protein
MNKEEWNAGRILQVSGSYWQSCTLHAGVKLDVFTLIGWKQLRGEDLAKKLNGHVRGLTTLLNALAALGLLEKRGSRYANTEVSKRFLVKDSPQYVGYIIMHHHHLVGPWSKLPDAATTGPPVDKSSVPEDEQRESFLMGMFNLAMGIAPALSKELDLSGKRHLLDLGGGPGTYAIHFCLANPDLKGTVFDLRSTRPFALKTIERFGLSGRVDFMDGDYLKDPISGEYDVAWLSHILHGEGPESCQMIIDKVVQVMAPGGMILIHDFILNNDLDGPLFPALFSLNMLVNTRDGRSYSEEQIIEMLRKAGAGLLRRLPFQGPNESGIISGVLK